jgi:hypothetical protein
MTAQKRMAVAVALIIGLSISGAAAQWLTIGDYQRPTSDADMSFKKGYLSGVKDGLIAYNMAAGSKLFCLSGDLPTLSFEQADDLMMSRARKKGRDIGGTPINMALLNALREAYPCHASAR